jgi:hypothetical protein
MDSDRDLDFKRTWSSSIGLIDAALYHIVQDSGRGSNKTTTGHLEQG